METLGELPVLSLLTAFPQYTKKAAGYPEQNG